MAAGDATAADVPGRYDVVIDGKGYMLLRSQDQRARYRRSPTFVDRQNVSNAYGDNAQDFFLTVRQRDWSLGEQQKYFRQGSDGRYWLGSNVDVSTPGQVALSSTAASVGFSASVVGTARFGATDTIATASSAKLFTVAATGTITDQGNHGLGATPSKFGLCTDGSNVFLSTTTAGTVGVRKWNGSVFSTFSATPADSLCYVNNTLFGYRLDTSALVQYDTAGTATTIFTWKDAAGSAGTFGTPRLHPYGGKVLIQPRYAQESSELWIYDGTGVARLAAFPENFEGSDLEVLYGVAYVAGSFVKQVSGSYYLRPAVLFFDGSQVGKLWEANSYNTTTVGNVNGVATGPHPSLGISDGRLIFTDETTGNVMKYDPARGGVSSTATFTANSGSDCTSESAFSFTLQTRTSTTGYLFPSGSYPSSGYVVSSLIDFDSSLQKLFRSVTVEYDEAADGDGGSVDVAYQIDSVAGSFTSLATGVTSGSEVEFPTAVAGHAVALKVTLNRGTSTVGPVLKSYSVKAAPSLQSFRAAEYVIDCSGVNGKTPVRLNNGEDHVLDGLAQAQNLNTAVTATPFSITDSFGTFTGIVEPDKSEFLEVRPDEFVVKLTVREV